jgi:hypothetical protein
MPHSLIPCGSSHHAHAHTQDGVPTDEFYMLTDNGFGNRLNSPDAMLMFHKIKANFTGKKATVASWVAWNARTSLLDC